MSSTTDKHTMLNLPWSIQEEQYGTTDRTVHVLRDADGLPVTIPAYAPDAPDPMQEALVAVVNAYPVLVAALHTARLQIEYLHGKFQETGSGNQALAQIDAALGGTTHETPVQQVLISALHNLWLQTCIHHPLDKHLDWSRDEAADALAQAGIDLLTGEPGITPAPPTTTPLVAELTSTLKWALMVIKNDTDLMDLANDPDNALLAAKVDHASQVLAKAMTALGQGERG